MINRHTYPFKIRLFATAKSFITYTKGCSGYYACSKCTVRGEYYRDRMIYPYLTRVKLQKRGAASDDLELGIYCQGRGPE